MILYGPIQERALDEAQRQIKPVVAVNKPPAVNSRRGGVSWDRCPARLHARLHGEAPSVRAVGSFRMV
jgi:hypothetical protein